MDDLLIVVALISLISTAAMYYSLVLSRERVATLENDLSECIFRLNMTAVQLKATIKEQETVLKGLKG